MNDILFTIAIPTYNNANIIKSAISSCLNQDTDVAYEVLVVNNACQDNTENILSQFNDEKIRIVTNEKTVSLYENHNVCIKNALGKYIIFCHADDTLEDHAIETFAKKLKTRNYPKKYVVWGHTMYRDFYEHAIYEAGFNYNEIAVGEYAPMMFLYGGLQPTGTCYHREAFEEIGGFLPVDMNTAPSDMTTMIYMAMNGFRFEMIDEMILDRTYATTSGEANNTSYIDDLDEAFKDFIKKVDQEEITRLISKTTKQKMKPYYFYYAITQDSYHKKQIKPIIRREIIKKPWILKSTLIRELLKRLYR